ncbi:MAG: hypothetical protein V1913_17185 [Fibrobacterota bacterium]
MNKALLFFMLLPAALACLAQGPAAVSDNEGFTIERPEDEAEKKGLDSSAQVPLDNAREQLKIRSGEELKARHSPWLAFASLAVPGLAEYQLGQKKLGKTLMVTDGLLWLGLAASFVYRSARLDDLRAYLFTYGGCDGRSSESGRSAWALSEDEMEFALYADSSAFYEERVFKPSRDPLMQKIDFYWQWDSEETHQVYYDMWKGRNAAKVYGYYFLGTAVVLRAASFIHARYVAKNEKTAAPITGAIQWQVYPGLIVRNAPGALLSVRF